MKYSTLQLILKRWYSGVEISDDDAVKELERRGWIKPFRVVFLALLLPFILPERIIVALDMGDPWEEAGWKTVVLSITFSAWMVSPVVLLVSGLLALAKWFDGNSPNWWPAIISGLVFVVTSLAFSYRVWNSKRNEA